MSATYSATEPTGPTRNRAKEQFTPETASNDDQPEQDVIVLDRQQIGDWLALGLLGAGGVLTLGWSGLLVWGLWKLIALVVF